MNKQIYEGLIKLFETLQQVTRDTEQHDKLIDKEACKHKESIRELCEENGILRRKLWEYENNYRVGKYPTSE
tara:strand:+ start:417 stop:632 length:216 start_codon:yes stop_codon:yes gene_type:complete